jgi:hypothetical protein
LLTLLGLLSIGAAYDMALQFSASLVQTMIPIIILSIVGTYLLFSQCLVMLLRRLRRPGISGVRLLLVARLSQRMRDYARMLTVVTVLNTVVLTGLGAVFGVLQLAEAEQALADPFALQYSVNALHPAALTPVQIQEEIAHQRFTLQTIITTPIVEGIASVGHQSTPVSVMSLSDFVRLQKSARGVHPELAQYQNTIRPLISND